MMCTNFDHDLRTSFKVENLEVRLLQLHPVLQLACRSKFADPSFEGPRHAVVEHRHSRSARFLAHALRCLRAALPLIQSAELREEGCAPQSTRLAHAMPFHVGSSLAPARKAS